LLLLFVARIIGDNFGLAILILKKNVLNKRTKKSLDDCNFNEEYLCTQWTNELYICVRGTLFLVGDDETERDRQLIGHGMTHLIQVR